MRIHDVTSTLKKIRVMTPLHHGPKYGFMRGPRIDDLMGAYTSHPGAGLGVEDLGNCLPI